MNMQLYYMYSLTISNQKSTFYHEKYCNGPLTTMYSTLYMNSEKECFFAPCQIKQRIAQDDV